jgi:hypothetical protein
VLNILTLVSQEEPRVISERITDILAHKKPKHERIMEVPYGWQLARDGVYVVANAREQGVSLRQIGHELTERGMYPRCGRAWHPESVSK